MVVPFLGVWGVVEVGGSCGSVVATALINNRSRMWFMTGLHSVER